MISPRMNPQELCNYYEPERLAALLRCSVRTARRYQSGDAMPRPAELVYLELIQRGRVMPREWPEHFNFTDCGRLSTKTTEEPLEASHLEQYNWIMGEWYHIAEHATGLARIAETLLEKLRGKRDRERLRGELEVIRGRASDPPEGVSRAPYRWKRVR